MVDHLRGRRWASDPLEANRLDGRWWVCRLADRTCLRVVVVVVVAEAIGSAQLELVVVRSAAAGSAVYGRGIERMNGHQKRGGTH